MTSPVPPGDTRTVDLPGGLSVTIEERGGGSGGRGFLLLHGGAGPRTMAGLASALTEHAYTVVPTHPGFQGTPRPEWCDTPADLAVAYLDLLDTLGLSDVMVIGSSLGGWVACEMALRDTRARIGSLTLLNAVGIHAARKEDAVVDTRALAPAEIAELSFADPAFRPDFSSLSNEQRAQGAANQRALALYGGEKFSHDPKLRGRLHRVGVPVLVVWGEQDGIASATYGRDYADSFPNGHFAPIPEAGHFPHIEQPGRTLGAIGDFADAVANRSAAA